MEKDSWIKRIYKNNFFWFRFGKMFCAAALLGVIGVILHYNYPAFWVISGSLIGALIIGYGLVSVYVLIGRAKPWSGLELKALAGIKTYSIKSKINNAFATSFGNNKSVVYTSKLLEDLNHQELVAVTMHEIGHHTYADPPMSLIQIWLLVSINNLIVISLTDSLRTGILLAILFTTFTLPAYLAFSRYKEYRADRWAANNIGDYKDLISALEKLVAYYRVRGYRIDDKSWVNRYLSTHPTLTQRKTNLEQV